jgi:hypothetical protein
MSDVSNHSKTSTYNNNKNRSSQYSSTAVLTAMSCNAVDDKKCNNKIHHNHHGCKNTNMTTPDVSDTKIVSSSSLTDHTFTLLNRRIHCLVRMKNTECDLSCLIQNNLTLLFFGLLYIFFYSSFSYKVYFPDISHHLTISQSRSFLCNSQQ